MSGSGVVHAAARYDTCFWAPLFPNLVKEGARRRYPQGGCECTAGEGVCHNGGKGRRERAALEAAKEENVRREAEQWRSVSEGKEMTPGWVEAAG